MNRLKKIAVIAVSVCGMIIVGYLVAARLMVTTIRTVGMRPLAMAAFPREAYLILRGRRQMDWHGLHIKVDSNFVLDPSDSTVAAREVLPMFPMLGLPVTFVATGDSGSMRFTRERDRCASTRDRCIVREPESAGDRRVCLQYLGKPTNGTPGDFEFLKCRLPSGVEARFACLKPDCEKFEKVVDDAFASARDIQETYDAKVRDSTSR
jgi:hypothetical protein